MYKECNNCGRDQCKGRALKHTLHCPEWIPFTRQKYNMVELAAFRELVQYGEIKNVSEALSERRLGL